MPDARSARSEGGIDKYIFASDNTAGICPEAWAALADANADHVPAYGDDPWTARASDRLRDVFEADCEVFFCFNGTAANSMSLASLCESYHSIICHERAHVETDECGGPEFFSNGTKVLLVGGDAGKLDLDQVSEVVGRRSDIHFPKPRVLSMTQATELGTVYSAQEVGAVGETARRLGLRLHMDGARFANALASLNVSPKEITWQAGVDVLCLGGTKNGLLVGEVVIYFDRRLAEDFAYRCKQAGQLASKMRFISAPWLGMLEEDAWIRHASNANARASRLAAGLGEIDTIELIAPSEANAVFADLPAQTIEGLRERGWHFHTFIGTGAARFMCPWNTTEADVEALLRDAREASGAKRPEAADEP